MKCAEPLILKFAFVADTNVFIDANLVLVAQIRYKAESQNYTPGCCGFPS